MSKQHIEERSKDVGEMLGPLVEFALQSLREGGHRVKLDDMWGKLLSLFPGSPSPDIRPPYEIYSVTNGLRYRLLMTIGPAPREDPENPKQAELVVELGLPGTIDARVTISRRTDGPWTARAAGTLSLPVGHPLGELAHADRFLGLSREGPSRELTDRAAELGLMEMGHIYERATT